MTPAITTRASRIQLHSGASALALLLVWASPATAQTAVDPQSAPAQSGTVSPSGDQGVADPQSTGSAPADEDIVVTGVRASLSSAQAIKRNADQIVDSIVAEDIGKLPDRNVAEALQRITGVQIQRSFGEGSQVAIRGR
jgi:iron complex outermembrane receptor protein